MTTAMSLRPLNVRPADPSAFKGTDRQTSKVFWDTAVVLKLRITLLMALPILSLDRIAIQREIKNIGTR